MKKLAMFVSGIRRINLKKLCITGVMFPVILLMSSCAQTAVISNELNWPKITSQNRPWTRWWWMGSAVNESDLTTLLTQYQQAGLGGVEICPIYGVKGYEDKFIDFLSPQWMKMLAHTTQETQRLGLGVDMTTGTGWPFGGPWITEQTASSSLILKRYELAEGGKLTSKLPNGQLQYLLAVSGQGKRIDLTAQVKDGQLDWTAPAGQWRVYVLTQKECVQKVKRSAPGGAGYVVDPYSVSALDSYLEPFDKAFIGYTGKMPRSQFHDSFEYYGATWTNNFFKEFESRCGYDLRTQIEALFGDGSEDIVARVQSDYRRTISDLHLAYIERWTQWCHSHNSLSRNQAHGAPGNLVDLYAAADIPETEIFRTVDERQIPMLRFSSSAAHLKGTLLASSESFTWLGEHFQVPLSDIKSAADFLLLSGVNHIFFHGIPYSPPSSEWPGWQFYASVNFGPTGGLWRDLPAFNAYIARCQSILQSGQPDNDILLYFPVEDIWHTSGELLMPFKVHTQDQEKWLWPTSFYKMAMTLWNRGYMFDYVSDQFIQQARCENGKVALNGNSWRVILVPRCNRMPVETAEKLAELAKAGATILFEGALLTDVPGFDRFEQRQAAMRKILDGVSFDKTDDASVSRAVMNQGRWMRGPVEPMLSTAGVSRESVVDSGLRLIRRSYAEGRHYFVANLSNRPIDNWVTLATPARSVVILDPCFDNLAGTAAIRKTADGRMQIYLQLAPGQSCVLRTFTDKTVVSSAWSYVHKDGSAKMVEGIWDVKFIEGGPVLPRAYKAQQLESWTKQNDTDSQRFAGTAQYTIEIDLADVKADDWLLDLGRVCDSARVSVNGQSVGTLWSEPFQVNVGRYLRAGKNMLQVEVTNVAANRIRDLDRQKAKWKYFYDANVVNLDYKPLNASNWPLRDSGLLGPVSLMPLEKVQPLAQEKEGGKDFPPSR